MHLQATILLDLGNSETRLTVLSGGKSYHAKLSNRFAELPQDYRISKKYADGKTNIFVYDNVQFANGPLAEREFSNQLIRPTALESKTEQLPTNLTIHLAIIRTIRLLSAVNGVPVTALNVNLNFVALLPPLDLQASEQNMIDLIKSHTTVHSQLPDNFQMNYTIGEVEVYSEAVAAFFGAFYEEQNIGAPYLSNDFVTKISDQNVFLQNVEKNEKFQQGYVLVIDIGAGTTDVAVFLDGELIEMSPDTFNKGGNTVESYVSKTIRTEYRFFPPNVNEVVTTGILREGSKVHDVREIVTAGKKHYSSLIETDIQRYLEGLSIEMRAISGLLVVGGGSLESKRDGEVVSPSMSKVLVEFLQRLAPNVELVDTEGKDLRNLNIEGVEIIAKHG